MDDTFPTTAAGIRTGCVAPTAVNGGRRMSNVTYDQIEPNVADLDVAGNKIKVTWKCPVSGAIVAESNGYMQVDQAKAMVKRGVARTIQIDFLKNFMNALAGMFGAS